MKLGILLSVTGLKAPDFVAGARLARELGYDCVELGGCLPGGGGPTDDLGRYPLPQAREVIQAVRAEGTPVSAIQCHVDLIAPSPEALAERVAHTKGMLDIAGAADVPFVHTVSGPVPTGADEGESLRRLAATYSDLLDHAAAQGVALGIEPVFVYAVGNLATMAKLDSFLGRDDLKVNFDPSHFPYHREDPVPFVRAYGPRIVHAHTKDATVTPLPAAGPSEHHWDMGGGEQFAFAPPGKGVLDWPAILGALQAVGFEGVLSLELGHGIADETQAARDTVEFLRPLLTGA